MGWVFFNTCTHWDFNSQIEPFVFLKLISTFNAQDKSSKPPVDRPDHANPPVFPIQHRLQPESNTPEQAQQGLTRQTETFRQVC